MSEENNLNQFKFPCIIRRVVTIKGCSNIIEGDRCNHNAAYVVDNKHPLGKLVQCTACGHFQIIGALR